MKTSKTPEVTEVTPSKKKLKQARLPFKLISEGSPSPVTPPSRKRKLSPPDDESVTKIGKISKENDKLEDPVVISDESRDGENVEEPKKMPNPYVKLVDTAWKKKFQKTKGARKRKNSNKNNPKHKVVQNGTVNIGSDTAEDDTEMMEVDDPTEQPNKVNGAKTDTCKDLIQKQTENENVNKPEVSEIVVLDDSNNSSDVKQTMASLIEKSDKTNHVQSDSNDESEDEPESLTDSKQDKLVTNTDKDDLSSPKESPDSSDSESKESPEIKDSDMEDNHSPCSKDKESSSDSEDKKSNDMKVPITPKRSARNKAKSEEINSATSPSSKLNKSITSNPSTPKQSKGSSTTHKDESVNESTPSNNLTPKQLQKKLESAKKREEREKEKQEREKKRLEEKEERARQRHEKEEQRRKERDEKEEAKRKEKEEKEEQRKKEKEERERVKESERKQREEKEEQKRKEKEEKEEQKRKEREAKEEDRRKKQEALELEKQEQELKRKKTAEAFVNFFVPKQKTEKDQPTVGLVSNNMLSSFTLKSDMRLAPTTRVSLTEDRAKELVKLIEEQSVKQDGLYLKSLKNGVAKPQSRGKTWPLTDKDDDEDDVILVEDELPPMDGAGEILTCEPANREKLRPKLLSFHANQRPPYWGTWRKKSQFVKPRRPFGQDKKQLDYEVDSDEEWEEEQEGESIDGSAAGSDDEQGDDEYEVDNEVFVPHGYLSDEEATMDEDDVLSLSPETQKAKLKHLEDEFESEMKKPTEKLKPRLYGLLWEDSTGGKPDKCVDAMWSYFGKLAMIMNDPTPLLQPANEPEETEKKKVKKKKSPKDEQKGNAENSPKADKKRKPKPEEKDKTKTENKKNAPEAKKNQPGINMFLTKLKSS